MDWTELEELGDEHFATGALSEPIQYAEAGGGGPHALRAVFSAQSLEVDPETGVAVLSDRPTAGIRLSDLPVPPREKDQLVARGVLYEIVAVRKRDAGWAELDLHRLLGRNP